MLLSCSDKAILNPLFESWKEAESDMNNALRRIMSDELEESWSEGHSEGRSEGRSEGLIEGAISAYKELGIPIDDSTARIMIKFSLSKDKADAYMEKYW